MMERKLLGLLPCYVGQDVIMPVQLSSVDVIRCMKPANILAAHPAQSRRSALAPKVSGRGCRFTSDQKEAFTTNAGVTITTYTMISYSGRRSEESAKVRGRAATQQLAQAIRSVALSVHRCSRVVPIFLRSHRTSFHAISVNKGSGDVALLPVLF